MVELFMLSGMTPLDNLVILSRIIWTNSTFKEEVKNVAKVSFKYP